MRPAKRLFVTDPVVLDGASRRFVSEVLYSTDVMDGLGSISAFGQVELNNRELGIEQTAISWRREVQYTVLKS